jgi:hypothetical protein
MWDNKYYILYHFYFNVIKNGLWKKTDFLKAIPSKLLLEDSTNMMEKSSLLI